RRSDNLPQVRRGWSEPSDRAHSQVPWARFCMLAVDLCYGSLAEYIWYQMPLREPRETKRKGSFRATDGLGETGRQVSVSGSLRGCRTDYAGAYQRYVRRHRRTGRRSKASFHTAAHKPPRLSESAPGDGEH